MVTFAEEKLLCSEIQKKLFYMIPERWESIYLYASVIDSPGKKQVGEMFFYYFPKGILKKNAINVYEIPSIFDIEEEDYSVFVNDLYQTIKQLKSACVKKGRKPWTNITISIANMQFKIEYDYEDLSRSEYTPYERHVIWRYKYLHLELDLYSKKEKKIIERYLENSRNEKPLKKSVYIENLYKIPTKNIVDYERTLTVDAAIAQSKQEIKEKKSFFKRKKQGSLDSDDEAQIKNQILF